MLSAAVTDPIAYPLIDATPASGTLADGTTSPQSSVFTPAQLRSAYGINNIKLEGVTGDGTGQTIAIITAFDDPALVNSTDPNFSSSDLHIFDQQFGIADPPSFTKIMQSSSMGTDTSWAEEASLDVEWTHAIAPGAKIVLVESQGATAGQLLQYGVRTAENITGVSVVNMSFGFGETANESNYDSIFQTPSGHTGVTFVASTGDSGVPGTYPAYSTRVLAVGGTSLSAPGGNYSSETAYSSSGGGVSKYEPKPSYQSSVTQSSNNRTIPDVSINGDQETGVDVYDSFNGGYAGKWYKIAGTSFSAPAWSGLIAIANQGRSLANLSPMDGPTQTLPAIYAAPSSDFHDITTGSNGDNAGPGYDLVTGRGSPIANLLVPAIAGVPSTAPTTGTASIAGEVYSDSNSDGKLNNGETGLAGATMFIDANQNGVLDNGETSTTTSSTGAYSFSGLAAGVYQVREVIPSGYKFTNPTVGFYYITVQNNWHITGENWGNFKPSTTTTGTASIAGTVYTDTNGNGKLDNGEAGLSGVELYIDLNKSGSFASGDPTFTTGSNGAYYFGNLPAGVWQVREMIPTGYKLTNPTVGFYNITVQNGWNITGENWGNQTTSTAPIFVCSVAGTDYTDINGNGKLDNGETAIAGVTMFIDTNHDGQLDNGEISIVTNSTGQYSFSFTTPGTYRVVEVVPAGKKLTKPLVGYYDIALQTGWNVTGENWGNQ